MNRETYIRKVKKQLDCSVKEKEEIVRDLQEILILERAWKKRKPDHKTARKTAGVCTGARLWQTDHAAVRKTKSCCSVLAVGGLFCLYALGESLRFRMPKMPLAVGMR